MEDRKRKVYKRHKKGKHRYNNKRKSSDKIKQLLVDARLFTIVFVITLTLMIGVGTFFYSLTVIQGYEMLPSLRDRDIILVEKDNRIKRFDLIVLDNGLEGDVKRIIGLPGETVRIHDDSLFVNDERHDEKFIVDKVNEYQMKTKNFTENFTYLTPDGKEKIPEGCYLVLGDNRPHTTDSRDYGVVTSNKIIGKVTARLWPLEDAQKF